MLGSKSGVATKLKASFPRLISWHCFCDRFGLHFYDIKNDDIDFKELKGTFIPQGIKQLKNCIDTLPVSTAECERGFSKMNLICSSLRWGLSWLFHTFRLWCFCHCVVLLFHFGNHWNLSNRGLFKTGVPQPVLKVQLGRTIAMQAMLWSHYGMPWNELTTIAYALSCIMDIACNVSIQYLFQLSVMLMFILI